jgi:hypothetical protein
MFRFGGELMGPILEGLPGSPRLFARAGLAISALQNREVLEIGEIGTPEDGIQDFYDFLDEKIADGCQDPSTPDCPTAAPEDFEGQGSEIEASFLDPSWYAGAGIAFTLPLPRFKGALRVKPSVEYVGERIDMRGTLTSVTEEPPDTDTFLVHRSAAEGSTTDHSLGPGLELEVVLISSARPIATSFYVDSRFLWLLGNRTTSFGGPTVDPDGDPTGTAVYTVRRDALDIRVGGGVRFSWMGFSGK